MIDTEAITTVQGDGHDLPENTAHVRENDERTAVDGSQFASDDSFSKRNDDQRY